MHALTPPPDNLQKNLHGEGGGEGALAASPFAMPVAPPKGGRFYAPPKGGRIYAPPKGCRIYAPPKGGRIYAPFVL